VGKMGESEKEEKRGKKGLEMGKNGL